MKVLHIFNEINFSGAEIMYANAAPLFIEKGIDMYALSTGKKEGDFASVFRKSGIKVFHIPINTVHFPKLSFILKIINLIKKEKIEIIHIHRSSVKGIFSLIGYLVNVKCVFTVHNVFKQTGISWFKEYLIRYISKLIFKLKIHTIGKSVYENEQNYYFSSSIQINNWFDNKKFFPSEHSLEKKELRKKYNISDLSYVIVSAGACSNVKNHKDILKAISLLKIDYNIEITYLHLGCGVEEQEEIEFAHQLNLSNNVKFLGNQKNVREYYVMSDAYIMPSKFEGLSIASIEAMACGLPSILYDVPGLRDVIVNNKNGLLIKPDYKLLAESIKWFKDNPNITNQMRNYTLKYVNEFYSMKLAVQNIIKMYNN